MKNTFSKIVTALFVVFAFTMSSCTKEHILCPQGYHRVVDQYGVEDCAPDNTNPNPCTTCGGGTVTPPAIDTTTAGVTAPITSGYLYGSGQAYVHAFKRDASGKLVTATTPSGNAITSPTIWGVQLFDSYGNAVGWALLDNGTQGVGANQKLKDFFSSYPGTPLYVTVEVNVNGDPFGELQTGTKMFFHITAIPDLGI
jgi:hypothetical protein